MTPSVADMICAAAQDARVTPMTLALARRGPIRDTRWRVMSQAHDLGHSYASIARAFGMDHSSVIYAVRKVRA